MPHPAPAVVAELAGWTKGPVVSVYLPVAPAGRDPEFASRRRRAAQTAREQLVSKFGVNPAGAAEMVAPIADGPSPFNPTSRGGAWFIGPEGVRILDFPVPVGPAVEVEALPDLLRVLPFLDEGPQFVLVALSQKHVRVLKGDRFRLEQLTVPGMPKELADAVWYRKREPQLIRQASGAMHGTGGAADLHKEDVRIFVHAVQKALEPVVAATPLPLVVVGVGYEAAMLVNEWGPRPAVAVAGNPDHLNDAELHERAWQAASSLSDGPAAIAAKTRELAGTGRVALDADGIVAAAERGALSDLLVARPLTVGGHRDLDHGALVHAVAVALGAGRAAVHVVGVDEMPVGASVAGVLRY
jgi:hypothetical protein